MANCSPGKSFDLHKTKRQGKTKTTIEIYKILKDECLTSNDAESLTLPTESNKPNVRKRTFIPVYDSKKSVCENKRHSNNVDTKTENWLRKLPPVNNYVR